MMRRVAAVVLTAAALLLVGGAFGRTGSSFQAQSPAASPDPLVAGIERMQERLKRLPGDWTTWAALGMSYVERARVTGDPALYARAESALNESQRIRPNDAALTGLGSLANSRHDFAGAATSARQALELNPYSAEAYGVLADALTQLGDAPAATQAVQRMLDLDPSLPALSRAAYDLEQHGNTEQARDLWARASRDAMGSNAAFVHEQLGDLAWNSGDLGLAESEYRLAQHQLGLARVFTARGETVAALEIYADLAATRPSPSLLAEYAIVLSGNLHLRPDLMPLSHSPGGGLLSEPAAAQLRLADAALALMAANGAADNLAAAEVAIARGDFAAAVRLCQAEWNLRRHTDVADMLGWSLHLAGRSEEALAFARKAVALGIRHRAYSAHLSLIEESLR